MHGINIHEEPVLRGEGEGGRDMTGRLWADNAVVGPFSKLLQIIDFCSVPRSIFLARDMLCFRDR